MKSKYFFLCVFSSLPISFQVGIDVKHRINLLLPIRWQMVLTQKIDSTVCHKTEKLDQIISNEINTINTGNICIF